MTYYFRRSDGTFMQFSGMALDVVLGMLASMHMTATQVTKEIYDAGIAAAKTTILGTKESNQNAQN